jgi:hypothetical protein
LRRRTTWLAAVILVATAVTALVLQGSGGSSVAARVGSTTISNAAVNREVAAIQAQPEYEAALQNASTLALAAPVSPQAVASANGDPDDLRISLVPVGGAASTRPYTTEDLQAAVLTRLMYLGALQQLLAARHVSPTAAELLDGREEAQERSGIDSSGASLFDRLPSWYQTELAERGADVEALTNALVGTGDITPSALEAAYQQRQGTDYTTVCLHAIVVSPQAVAAGRAALLAGGAGSLNVGCAPVGSWTAAAVVAFGTVPVGGVSAPLIRNNHATLIRVTSRTVQPLSAVAGDVKAALDSRYTDLVNTMVEDQLGISKVQVAPQYGTYESLGEVHNVLPPDALTPPPGPAPSGPPTTSPPQRPDPFD